MGGLLVQDVGARIRELRRARRLRQDDLAEVLGVPQSTISKYENGKAKMYLNDLPKIAEFLQVHPCVLFDDQAQASTDPEVVGVYPPTQLDGPGFETPYPAAPTPAALTPTTGQRVARRALARILQLPEADLEAFIRVADRMRELPSAEEAE